MITNSQFNTHFQLTKINFINNTVNKVIDSGTKINLICKNFRTKELTKILAF